MSIVTARQAASADDGSSDWVRSNFETAFGSKVARDCGYSEPIPDRPHESLWVFCDTTVLDPRGVALDMITGSTAARGPTEPGTVPTALSEVPSPPKPMPAQPYAGAPEPFLGRPTGLVHENGEPCSGPGAASWISGLTRIPETPRLLVTYVDVCIEKAWDWVAQGLGMAEYDPASNTLGPRVDLFRETSGRQLAPQLHLASPVFVDGQLYLFSHLCDNWVIGACASGRVFVARVPVGRRHDPGAYRFRHHDTWTADAGQATSVLSGGRPVSLHVDDYGEVGRSLVLLESTAIDGRYRVWEADDPAGPWWSRTAERSLDGCVAPSGRADLCHALIGHAGASTAGGLAVSYHSATDRHVHMTTVPW